MGYLAQLAFGRVRSLGCEVGSPDDSLPVLTLDTSNSKLLFELGLFWIIGSGFGWSAELALFVRPARRRSLPEIGFVLHFTLHTSNFKLLTIGFVFPRPVPGPIRHNSFPHPQLSFLWPVPKLGLFGAEDIGLGWLNNSIREIWE